MCCTRDYTNCFLSSTSVDTTAAGNALILFILKRHPVRANGQGRDETSAIAYIRQKSLVAERLLSAFEKRFSEFSRCARSRAYCNNGIRNSTVRCSRRLAPNCIARAALSLHVAMLLLQPAAMRSVAIKSVAMHTP